MDVLKKPWHYFFASAAAAVVTARRLVLLTNSYDPLTLLMALLQHRVSALSLFNFAFAILLVLYRMGSLALLDKVSDHELLYVWKRVTKQLFFKPALIYFILEMDFIDSGVWSLWVCLIAGMKAILYHGQLRSEEWAAGRGDARLG
jgi:hypothetical protein